MSDTHQIDLTDTRAGQDLAGARDLLSLLKPRVMSLVIFTALIGLLMAPGHLHPVLAIIAVICISVGAGASGALNMWFDADIDARMARTRGRPIPRGLVEPGEALGIGLVLSVASVATLGLFVNLVAAGLLAFTIFFYAVIYTMWLKRRTAQNIVIGGAAGALPPVIGWASVTGGVDVLPLMMFALIFFWTPPHFWALSLSRSEEYEAAGVPMLPVTAGAPETRKQILIYALLLWPVALAPVALGLLGLLYAAAAIVLNAMLTALAWRLWRHPSERHANSLFVWSIPYLFLLFLLMPLDRWLGAL